MKGLFWFFCGFTVFTSTQIQEGSSTFKVGRILDMPLAIRGITPKDLRAIHKEVGDKTWEDIRHLFVIKPTQALLNLLQVPLAKDKLVILPQKDQEEMSLVNVMVEETPTTEMEPVVETTTIGSMKQPMIVEEETMVTTRAPVTGCGTLSKTCKISIHPKMEKLGFALCFHYQTGLLGQCIYPETVPSCQPDVVVLCHPFPELAELFLKNLPTRQEDSKTRSSHSANYATSPILMNSSGKKLSVSEIQDLGKEIERAIAIRVSDNSQRAIELVQDIYLMAGLEIVPRLVILVGSNQDYIRANLQKLHDKPQLIAFGIWNPDYKYSSPEILKQNVQRDLFTFLLEYLQFKGPRSEFGTQPKFTHEIDQAILNFAVLANEGLSFQTRTEVANALHSLEFFKKELWEQTSWITELDVPQICSYRECQAFTVDQSVQFDLLRTAFSLDCEECHSKSLRNAKSLLQWINMGIEFKEEVFGLVKLVPFWIKSTLAHAIRPENDNPESSLETPLKSELKRKETLKYCRLTKTDQDLCLNLQTGGIDKCPFKVDQICRETQIIDGFQRFHKVVPGGKLDVPYVPERQIPPPTDMESRIFGLGSSSSPWFQIGINLRRNCRCLTPQEIYSETKTIVDRPCSQPIPWCYVDYDANCLDKEFQFHPVALWWSQEACRRETSIFSDSYVDFNYYN